MIIEQPASSLNEQAALEQQVARFYRELAAVPAAERAAHLALRRDAHAAYIHKGLARLPAGFIGLDASRPWLLFWMTHSLALLQQPLPQQVAAADIVQFLQRCQDGRGGFGGGPGQLPHLAPTYAAVATLVTLGGPEALQAVDRPATLSFLHRMCVPAHLGGGFTLCEDGEVDVRGCYCAMATAHMLGLDAPALAQAASMVGFLRSCQTYEGGIGGEPGNEAHGGYTFCGVAAASLAGAAQALDLGSLARWAASCQGTIEGGFMGRTNKLVDGCYSYWQGALFPLLQSLQLPPQLAPAASAADAAQTAVGASAAASAAGGGEQQQQQAPAPVQQAASAAPAAAQQSAAGGRITVPPLPRLSGRTMLQHATDAVSRLEALHLERSTSAAPPVDLSDITEAGVRAEGFAAAAQSCTTVLAMRPGRTSPDKQQAAAAAAAGARQPPGPAASQADGSDGRQAAGGTGQRAADEDGCMSCHPAAIASACSDVPPLYDVEALQLWLLQCCQAIKGGLRDKPGKPVDYYHTCYCLSGLSAAQHYGAAVAGPPENLLAAADPLCNVVHPRLAEARRFYSQLAAGGT